MQNNTNNYPQLRPPAQARQDWGNVCCFFLEVFADYCLFDIFKYFNQLVLGASCLCFVSNCGHIVQEHSQFVSHQSNSHLRLNEIFHSSSFILSLNAQIHVPPIRASFFIILPQIFHLRISLVMGYWFALRLGWSSSYIGWEAFLPKFLSEHSSCGLNYPVGPQHHSKYQVNGIFKIRLI